MDDGRDEFHFGHTTGWRTSRHSIELVVQPPTRRAERLTQVHQVKCPSKPRTPFPPTPINAPGVIAPAAARIWAGAGSADRSRVQLRRHRSSRQASPFPSRFVHHAVASCPPSPTVRAARMTRPVRESIRNCFDASCFLHYRSDAARRFADRSLSCAAGAAAQAPLGLSAGCKTAFMSRVLGRQGSRIRTPFGASFSHSKQWQALA